MVKLIRSKGVGIYFCTQAPSDIPDDVLAQLGNRIQHALHAYTPKDQKAVKAAAQSFRINPEMDTYQAILELGVGEAVCSFLEEDGVPGVAQKVIIAPPVSQMGAITEEIRRKEIQESLLAVKYAEAVDPDSAYEFLQRKASQEAADAQKLEEEKMALAEAARQQAAEEKEKEKEKEKARKARERSARSAAKSVGNSVAGTIGREVGKSVGGSMFGKFGKTLGGNVGASLGRGIIGTLFRK